MKNLIISKFEDFINITSEFETPMKIFSVESVSQKRVVVSAWCFLRTFYISWEQEINVSELDEKRRTLEKNDFIEGKLIEDKKIEIVE